VTQRPARLELLTLTFVEVDSEISPFIIAVYP